MASALIAWLVTLMLVPVFSDKCPESNMCKCTEERVECQNIQNPSTLLQEIQNLKRHQIDNLKLKDLHLPFFPAGLFKGVSIKRLFIENSTLDNLYSVENAFPSPFEGLENSLTEIYVKNTQKPSTWYWPDMKNFKVLRRIIFTNSPVGYIGHNFAEIGDGSLETIVVRHGKVNRIHPQAFPELTNLRYADFENNRLLYLVRTMFPNPAPRLEILSFKKNRLFTLDENLFENMPALTYLDLSGNELTHFKTAVFTPVWNQLDFVSLHGNSLECDCQILQLQEKKNKLHGLMCLQNGIWKKLEDFFTTNC